MIATLNCLLSRRRPQFFHVPELQNQLITLAVFAFCFLPILFAGTGHAETISADPMKSTAKFSAQAEKIFRSTQTRFRAEPGKSEAALQFGQACFDWAEFADNNEQRERIALEGIVACRKVIALQPKSAAGHYYLAMNLGQLARTKTLGALRLVDEMETEFQSARDLDEHFDYAGPDRNLGLLYAEAPGWPTSIGNRSKARHHLQRAVLLHPEYPDNHLNLLEAYLKWGEKTGAQREFNSLNELWPKAKKKLSGEKWELSWIDWEKRWKKIQMKYAEFGRNLETPRGKK